MANLYHLILRNQADSGHVWDEFYCPRCLENWIMQVENIEIICQTIATPQLLSRLYPPLMNEPHCRKCVVVFTY